MNAKKIALLVVGLVLGTVIANIVLTPKAEAVENTVTQETILGHRIGPGGVEMLVIKH